MPYDLVAVIMALCLLCGRAAAGDREGVRTNVKRGAVMTLPNSKLDEPRAIVEQGTSEVAEPNSLPEALSEEVKPDAGTPLSIIGARVNFKPFVENFITQNSPAGYWPLGQQPSGKALRLRFDKVEGSSLREVAPGHFAGSVAFRQIDAPRPVQVEFFMDFSGARWEVEEFHLMPDAPPAEKPKKQAGKGTARPAPARP